MSDPLPIDPLAVSCPWCGAPPDGECVNTMLRDAPATDTHTSRRSAAEREAQTS